MSDKTNQSLVRLGESREAQPADIYMCGCVCKLDWVSDGQPITSGISWTPAADAASQDNWDIQVGSALGKTNIIQAGNSNSAPPTWGAQELIATENSTVKQYVATYAHHNYPGGTVQSLMTHSGIVTNVEQFDADVSAALGVGKPYVLGETNSGM